MTTPDPDSRRPLVTALFADVSGFTTLADRLDADALHEIIHPLITRLAGVAENHGGYIAKYGGDALLVLFGALGTADDDAARAVRVAGQMHRALTELRDELPEDGRHLQMHIGVGTGHVAFQIGDAVALDQRAILGEAVELAQRLEAAAPSGATYVDDTTRMLADDAATFEAVADAVVTGTSRVWRAVGESEHERHDDATSAALEALKVALAQHGDAGDIPEERRLVTVLFVDIAVEPSVHPAHEVIGDVVTRLAPIAERYEGYVAQYAHDALLAFFGAPIAHDDDAVRALLVAAEMHGSMPAILEDIGRDGQVQIRAGVNSGHVVSGWFGGEVRADFSILGDAVNLAQRLQSRAPFGETFVGEATYVLTAPRFAFDPVGPLQLKGKPEPVPAWRLGPQRRDHGRTPRSGIRRTPFIGRDAELATVTAVLEATTTTGAGDVLAVIGDAGVGKSRLTTEAHRQAATRGIRWLEARSISYGSGVAYWAYIELLRRTFDVGIEVEPVEVARRLRVGLKDHGAPEALPFFARLLGVEAAEHESVRDLEPEAFRRALERVFAAWLTALARRSPVVLAVEDVHWADAASVSLTTAVARATRDAPIVLYVTARPEGRAVVDEVAARGIDVDILQLEPLSESAVAVLVGDLLRGTPPAPLLDAVTRRAGGNPFFVEELVRSLLDAGVLMRDGERDGDHWTMHPGWDARTVPATVEGVLSARIDLLPRSAATTLTNASVIGRQVRLPILRGLDPDATDLDHELRTLVDAGFLDPVSDDEDLLLFHHALVQDVAYSRLLRRRRRELHGQVAQVAEGLYGAGDDVIDLLARHAYLGGGGDKAIELLLRAGERSRRLFANDEAILHLSRAEELARQEDDERLYSILMQLAGLHELMGDYDSALSSYGEVRDGTGDPRAWKGLASTLRQRSQYEEGLALADEAIGSGLATRDPGLWLERAWILTRMGRYEDSDEALDRGLAAVADDSVLAGQLLLQRAQNATLREAIDAAIAHADNARRILEHGGDLRSLARALRLLGDGHWKAGNHTRATQVLERGSEIAQRVGDREEIGALLITLGLVAWDAGELDRAIDRTLQAREEFESINHRSGQAIADANVGTILMDRGDLEDATFFCQRGLETARQIGHQMTVADALKTLAEIAERQGRFESAGEHARVAADLFAELGLDDDANDCLSIAERALVAPRSDRMGTTRAGER